MNQMDAYLDFIICVMRSDEVIHEREIEYFMKLLSNSGFNKDYMAEYENKLNGKMPIDIERVTDFISTNIDKDFLTCLIRDAFFAAQADGRLQDSEVSIINDLLKKCGVPEERFTTIKNWGEENIFLLKRGLMYLS